MDITTLTTLVAVLTQTIETLKKEKQQLEEKVFKLETDNALLVKKLEKVQKPIQVE